MTENKITQFPNFDTTTKCEIRKEIQTLKGKVRLPSETECAEKAKEHYIKDFRCYSFTTNELTEFINFCQGK